MANKEQEIVQDAINIDGNVSVVNGVQSTNNSSTSPLNAGNTFTGTADLNDFPDVLVQVATDQNGTLYIEFSNDGTNWDTSLSFKYDTSAINPPQIFTKASRYFRVRFENTSASNQTYLRLYTYYGKFEKLTSSLVSTIPQTFGATVTRPIDFNLMVAKGLYQGHENTIKDGINTDVDTGSVPEDIWQGGGVYTGFPTSAEAGEIIVSGADTGTLFYSYMESPTDTSYTFGSIAIAGAGTYALGHNIWRSNYMLFDNGTTSFNVGDITMRHTVTTTNIFNVLKAGEGQTFNAAYTVPQGHDIYIDRITGSIRGGNAGTYADCFFYYRESGKSPLLRFPFVLNQGSLFFDDVDYLLKIPQGTDLMPRVKGVGANNTNVHISYRIVKVKR